MVCKETSRAVDGTGDPRGNGLVDRNRTSAAVMGGGLVITIADIAIAVPVTVAIPFTLSIPLALSLSLSFLIPMGHFFVLLNRSMSVVQVAVPIVWSTAWAKILAVHACLERDWSQHESV